MTALEERFWAKVARKGPDECWPWTAYCVPRGYGQFSVAGRLVKAHTFAYELGHGPIPEGLEPDHLCRNPPCCNPAHLEPVTHRENVRRGDSPAGHHARAAQCPKGHPYDAENTQNDRGGRRCATCHRDQERLRYQAKKEKAV
jgi:HNH endonuclease